MREALVVGLMVWWLVCGCGSSESVRRDETSSASQPTTTASAASTFVTPDVRVHVRPLDDIDAGDHVADDLLSAVAELPPDAVQTGGSTRPEISLLPSDLTFLARRHFGFESAQGSTPVAFHGFGLGWK